MADHFNESQSCFFNGYIYFLVYDTLEYMNYKIPWCSSKRKTTLIKNIENKATEGSNSNRLSTNPAPLYYVFSNEVICKKVPQKRREYFSPVQLRKLLHNIYSGKYDPVHTSEIL